ncbi:MAG: tetratricopeptide repeat protein [Pseudomonadota bacterium]
MTPSIVRVEPLAHRSAGSSTSRPSRPLALALAAFLAWSVAQPAPALADAPVVDGAAGAFLAGHVALAEGQIGEAAASLARALETRPDDVDLARQVFALHLADGDVVAARTLAPLVIADGTDAAATDARLFQAIDMLGDDPAAALDLLALIEDQSLAALIRPLLEAWLAPDPGAAADRLAETDTQLGDLTVFHRAALLDRADRVSDALALLEDLRADAPTALPERVVAAQARLLVRADDPEAALQLLQQRENGIERSDLLAMTAAEVRRGRLPPPPFASPAAGVADALIAVGELLAAQRRLLPATVYVRLGLLADPANDAGWLLLGALLAEQEGPAAGIDPLARIDASSPFHGAAQLEIADLEARLGDEEAAVARLRGQVENRPGDARPAMALGDLLRSEARFEEAAEAYGRALDRLGETDARHWHLYYARGIAYERSQRWPEAERDLERALELQPDQPYVLNYLGYSWVDQGQHLDEAKAMLYRAVELRPEDGYIVDSLGWAYYRLGDFDRAVELLERAIELAPGDPVINDHLGDAYWRVGRLREARFQWERALVLDPEPEEVAEIEAKLENGLPEEDAG